ncbi:MAG TPA: putative metal-binding motif-containing protein [Polyangiaceae bacterium]|nr:putative metal-binding motif-containing protein [Polyangiaceae bacterium]
MRRLLFLGFLVFGCGHGTVADPFATGSHAGAGGEGADGEPGTGAEGGGPTLPAGECSDDSQCDDGIACTLDRCDVARGLCHNDPDDSACDNHVYCDGAEVCKPPLGCQPGPVVSCSDNSVCSIDTCVEETQSCKHERRDADGDGDPPLSCQGADCDDFNPLVSGDARERCDNGVDDDCDGEVDEDDCVRPMHDRCSSALEITAAGAYAVSTVGAAEDYGISCEMPAEDRAFRDVVIALTVPDGGPKDIDIVAQIPRAKVRFEPGELVLAATDKCGEESAETACVPSVVSSGDAIARLLWRGLPPGDYAVYVASDREADIELHVDFRDPEPAPMNETCGTAEPLVPGEPVRAILAGLTTDLESSCSSRTGELVYAFDLDEPMDVRVQAVSLDDYGVPVISLRDAACTDDSSEISCRAAAPASLYARALPAGSYRIALGGRGPTQAELVLSLSPPTKPPPTAGCSDPPALEDGVSEDVSLDDATDAVQIGCLVGAADATYALELGERADVMVVQTGSEGDTGAVLIAESPCETSADADTCRSSDQWPVRAVAHGVGPGSLRAVVETAESKPTSITAFSRPAVNSVFVQGADVCDDAFEIPVEGGRFEGNTGNQYADYETSCDYGGQDPGGAPEQMLELVLPERRRVVLDASGSNYQTILVIRRGDDCPGEEVLGTCSVTYTSSSADVPSFSFVDTELEPGHYFIQVDGYNGGKGRWALEVFSAKVSGDQGK